mmetsp:Transcript_36591/g.44170  ORF Transcript_36591/g.44170 Transcript_36591/m.44170 type:complete len:255 (+) Transcript_36591:156-920(+)
MPKAHPAAAARKKGGDTAERPKHKRGKYEIKFDPEDRHKYLTGFGDRKKERRTFGLAMQKKKDRKAKLENRKQLRETRETELEQLERKQKILQGEDSDSDDDWSSSHGPQSKSEDQNRTTSQISSFGGETVVVTTTYDLPSDSDAEDDERLLAGRQNRGKNIDAEQRWAGNVKNFMDKVSKNMPSKRKVGGQVMKKGRHGACEMKGAGGAAALNMARKTLAKVEVKGGGKKKEKGRKGKPATRYVKGAKRKRPN